MFLWWYAQTTASESEWLRCSVPPCCPVHYELAHILSIFTVSPTFCDGIIQTTVLWSQVSSFLFFLKISLALLTEGSSFQVNLLGCRLVCVWEEFSLRVLSYAVGSSLSGPVGVLQKEALGCLGSLSCWDRCSSVEKATSRMKAFEKALFSFVSVPYFLESKSYTRTHTVVRGFLALSKWEDSQSFEKLPG